MSSSYFLKGCLLHAAPEEGAIWTSWGEEGEQPLPMLLRLPPLLISSLPSLTFLLTLTPSGTTKNIQHFAPVTTL